MVGEVSFFEIGVDDPERARAFYASLFGWHFEPGPSGGGFLIRTPQVPGGMHGDDPGASPCLFFRVDDMESALQRVRELGGAVENETAQGEESTAVHGRFSLCRDDQGSLFGLHQPPSGT